MDFVFGFRFSICGVGFVHYSNFSSGFGRGKPGMCFDIHEMKVKSF